MATVTGAAAAIRRLQQYPVQYKATVRHVLVAGAARVEARMKAEHRWQNRTHAAERGLHAGVIETGAGFTLFAAHGPEVFYGAFLEHGFQGRFAVLAPTLRTQWPAIMQQLAAALREQAGVQRGGGG